MARVSPRQSQNLREMSKPLHIGVYPGTFDPVTFGHLDIIERATRLVDRLVVAVATNLKKGPLFSVEERVSMLERELKTLSISSHVEVIVKPFDKLLVNFAKEQGAQVLIRGLRAVSDFEYEFQMAGTNRKLDEDLETVFLVACESYQLVASNWVKEIARLGGDTKAFVSAEVGEKLRAKLSS